MPATGQRWPWRGMAPSSNGLTTITWKTLNRWPKRLSALGLFLTTVLQFGVSTPRSGSYQILPLSLLEEWWDFKNYIVKLFQSLPRAWYPAQYLLYLPITLLWNNALKLITWLTISNHCGLYQNGVITNLRNLLIRLAPKTVLSIIILQNCTFCSFWIPCKKVYDIIPFWLVSLSIKKGLSNSSQMEFF